MSSFSLYFCIQFNVTVNRPIEESIYHSKKILKIKRKLDHFSFWYSLAFPSHDYYSIRIIVNRFLIKTRSGISLICVSAINVNIYYIKISSIVKINITRRAKNATKNVKVKQKEFKRRKKKNIKRGIQNKT